MQTLLRALTGLFALSFWHYALAAPEWQLVSVDQGEHSLDIYYQNSENTDGVPENLSENNKLNDFTPVILGSPARETMVVWSEANGAIASQLKYRTLSDSGWSGAKVIESATQTDTAPTLVLDGRGRIWCFWVGFDGADDEIYFSVYENQNWWEPQRLYKQDNEVPDLFPTAILSSNGKMEVNWKRFDFVSRQYVDLITELIDDEEIKFSEPKRTVLNPFKSIARLPRGFKIPEGVAHPRSATIYFSAMPNHTIHYERVVGVDSQ